MRCVCMQICETSRIRHLHIQKLACTYVCMQTCDCVCWFSIMRCVCMQICETSRIRHLHLQKLSCTHVCMQTCDCVCRFGTKSFYGDARGHKSPALGPEQQPEPLYSCCICGRFFVASHPWQQIILHVDQPSGWIEWGIVCAFWPQCNQ